MTPIGLWGGPALIAVAPEPVAIDSEFAAVVTLRAPLRLVALTLAASPKSNVQTCGARGPRG